MVPWKALLMFSLSTLIGLIAAANATANGSVNGLFGAHQNSISMVYKAANSTPTFVEAVDAPLTQIPFPVRFPLGGQPVFSSLISFVNSTIQANTSSTTTVFITRTTNKYVTVSATATVENPGLQYTTVLHGDATLAPENIPHPAGNPIATSSSSKEGITTTTQTGPTSTTIVLISQIATSSPLKSACDTPIMTRTTIMYITIPATQSTVTVYTDAAVYSPASLATSPDQSTIAALSSSPSVLDISGIKSPTTEEQTFYVTICTQNRNTLGALLSTSKPTTAPQRNFSSTHIWNTQPSYSAVMPSKVTTVMSSSWAGYWSNVTTLSNQSAAPVWYKRSEDNVTVTVTSRSTTVADRLPPTALFGATDVNVYMPGTGLVKSSGTCSHGCTYSVCPGSFGTNGPCPIAACTMTSDSKVESTSTAYVIVEPTYGPGSSFSAATANASGTNSATSHDMALPAMSPFANSTQSHSVSISATDGSGIVTSTSTLIEHSPTTKTIAVMSTSSETAVGAVPTKNEAPMQQSIQVACGAALLAVMAVYIF